MLKRISQTQQRLKVGSHGEDYGSWISNPVFYLFGGLTLIAAALAALSFAVFHLTVLGVLFVAAVAVLLAVLGILTLAAFGVAWYLTDGDLAALPQRLKTLRLPEWVTLWQAHEPKPGARLI